MEALAADAGDKDLFAEHGRLAKDMYGWMVERRQDDAFLLKVAIIKHPWGAGIVLIRPKTDENELELRLNKIPERLAELGGSLEFETRWIKPASLDNLIQKVESTKNERARSEIVRYHLGEMHDRYVEHSDSAEAYFHGKLALRFAQKLDAADKNDIGYVAFATGHNEEARDLFLSSIDDCQGKRNALLPTYNLATLLAKESYLMSALERLDWCIENGKELSKTERGAACLFTLSLQDGSLKISESRGDLDLYKLAVDAKNVLEEMQRSGS